MSDCVKKLFNKEREKQFDKEFKERQIKMKEYIKANPNTPNAKYFKKTLKNMNLKKLKKKRIQDYRNTMCNPTCKGTLFESGDADKLPPSFLKELKKITKTKDAVDYQLGLRKEIFGKKNNVLKNGFYEKLDAETVNNLKKRGATSGCYRGGLSAYDLIRPLL
jgi:hypothetical protein